jgi:hypothetical protein
VPQTPLSLVATSQLKVLEASRVLGIQKTAELSFTMVDDAMINKLIVLEELEVMRKEERERVACYQ